MDESTSFGSVYGWMLFIVFGLPTLCGCFLIGATLFDARDNVQVWRQEFQYALEQQCPHLKINIEKGVGKVYLDAYQLEYQWHSGGLTCLSNGRTVRCNCAAELTETSVTRFQKEE